MWAVCSNYDQSGITLSASTSSLTLSEDNAACAHSLLQLSCDIHENPSNVLRNIEQIDAAGSKGYRLTYDDILCDSAQLVTLANDSGL